jgi:hypothetical protein
MELRHALDLAHDLTQRLHEALEDQDLQVCQDLLEQRGRAMEAFSRAHRSASEHQRALCHPALVSLSRADARLQERTQTMLTMVAGKFREQLGLSNTENNSQGREPIQACLDRKV